MLSLFRFAVDVCSQATAGQVASPAATNNSDPSQAASTCNNFNTGLPTVAANQATVTHALQLVFGIIGVVAVIYIMYAAFHFTRSQGDPQTIAKARQGIIFAILGLVIVVSAEVIVTFVLGQL